MSKFIMGISEKKYWIVFHKVCKDWDKLLKKSYETKISVADIIMSKYNITYKVAADIANSIALSIAIG